MRASLLLVSVVLGIGAMGACAPKDDRASEDARRAAEDRARAAEDRAKVLEGRVAQLEDRVKALETLPARAPEPLADPLAQATVTRPAPVPPPVVVAKPPAPARKPASGALDQPLLF